MDVNVCKDSQRGKFNTCFAIVIGLILLAASNAFAQELSVYGGAINTSENNENSYTWELSYLENIAKHFAWSVSLLNEGHLEGHHRDGFSFQAWANTSFFNDRLTIAAGAGPYQYFDTQPGSDQASIIDHGLGGVFSLAASWHTESRWLIQARANHVWTDDNIDTDAILLGIGYQLEPGNSSRSKPAESPDNDLKKKNEVTLFLGSTVLHSYDGEADGATAAGIEYRRAITPYLDWTIGLIHEGDVELSHRNGITMQIWPTRSFFDNRFSIGIGLGPYLAFDDRRDEQSDKSDETIAGLITLSGAYRFNQRFLGRFSFSRVYTNYDRDADIFLAGVGYQF